jgi:20S proteasome alpha/beta subunit
VVHEMLGSSEGCELYLMNPRGFGFSPGEELGAAEVREVGRLLRKTVIGVVTKGDVVLVADRQWRWTVADHDKIIAIADSW